MKKTGLFMATSCQLTIANATCMTYFTINDLESFSGIRKHTIRIWEQRYSFLQPKRNQTLRRVYTPRELTVLLNVARLNQQGFRVSRIAKMVEDKVEPQLTNSASQQIKAIHDLIIAMAEMDEKEFDTILKQCINNWGLNSTVQEVIMPFCERVGLLQSQENKGFLENILLVSDIIKQKIYTAIELVDVRTTCQKTVALFTTRGEQQELTILLAHYMLKKQGYHVVALGNHTTIENVTAIINNKKPDFVITALQEKKQNMEIAQFVKHLPETSSKTQWLTIGTSLPKLANLSHYKHADTLKQALAYLMND